MISFSISAKNDGANVKLVSTNKKFVFTSTFKKNKKEEIVSYLENAIGVPKADDTNINITIENPYGVSIILNDQSIKIKLKSTKNDTGITKELVTKLNTIVKDVSNIINS
ncbi:hypothetical protein D1816_22955 [Aquimarina sp. AD10]|uniref:hypothetical protein n=1 Tax=Aquimarina sp. AD10 TaxID=1714849 RepID=UPI000E46B587|nr:hypothetical protein [Aquimarina sp. AD10]AXT63083.1 hypothetical protein D1816_22955 [Aquimarina sp. AD10]RKM96884.1 hypothetical protein D7033_15330 [Aquimarina sp. AD10]